MPSVKDLEQSSKSWLSESRTELAQVMPCMKDLEQSSKSWLSNNKTEPHCILIPD
jgi:hypothetical protein